MGRGRRLSFPGAFSHCINRGNRREPIYRDEDDYQQMLKGLGQACERFEVRIHGYCLLPNHFHVLMQQQELPISSALRSLETQYAIYFNRKYHQTGHVFQGRFRSIVCDKAFYLLELIRYIHLNPVRARLVELPHQWKWSSLPALLGLSRNGWLYRKDVMELFGGRPRQRLLEFLTQAPGLTSSQMYPAPSLSILGSREFIREVTRHREPRRTRGRNDSGPKLPLSKLGEILGQAAGVTLEELCCPHKGSRRQSEVRERLVHVATRRMFYAGMEVARFLGVTSGAITLANRRFEAKLRQNPAMLDEVVDLLRQNT